MTEESGTKIIGSVADVIRYLQSEGYCAAGKETPVKRQKVYDDKKAGVLTFFEPKAITLTEVESYITRAMLIKRSGGSSRNTEIEELSALRQRQELEKLQIETRIKDVALKKDLGELQSKKEFELQAAMKIATMEAAMKHLHRTMAMDLIVAVGGDIKKMQVYLDLVYPALDDLLDQMGRMEEVKVIVKKREDGRSKGQN